MEEKRKAMSRLSGFIDGYKASNIASLESSIKYHFGEIKEKIQSIISSEGANKELLNSLKKAHSILDESDLDYFDKLIQFGEALKTTILVIKTEHLAEKLNDPRMKMIVYHYLELAEKIEDKRINTLAIAIGESF